MMIILFYLIMAVLLILNVYELQTLKDEIKIIKQEKKQKTKQFRREHANISKTNFRQHTKR